MERKELNFNDFINELLHVYHTTIIANPLAAIMTALDNLGYQYKDGKVVPVNKN